MRQRTILTTILTVFVCVFAMAGTGNAKTIYVDCDAAGANDGSSWADAYNYLQDALMFATAGDEIRVAQGIYRPDEFVLSRRANLGREESFQLKNGVTIKGGYAGFGQTAPNARDVALYKTILSGDLNGDDVEVADACDLRNEPSRVENSYHVVTASVTYAAAVLDGFTITGGNASSLHYEDPNSRGGGVYGVIPVLLNCTLTYNYASQGGGMFGWAVFVDCMLIANSAGTGGGVSGGGDFTNCTFIGNSARGEGGAIDGEGEMTGCTFRRNSAGYDGGVIYVCDNDGTVTFIDCSIEENSAGNSGGGVYVYQGRMELIDCILRGNSANQGGAVATQGSYFKLTDCSLTGNWASQSGGAVWNGGSMIMTSCSVTDNSAEQGGGISNNSDLILINCRLTGNYASQSGGGLWNKYGDLFLTNCTFAGNSADRGYALAFNPWEWSTDIQLTNCILWDGGNEIWDNDYSAEVTIAHSDVQGGPAVVYDPCNVVIWGEGNIDTDPCFADPGYWNPNGTPEDANDDFWVDGDYHLKSQAGRWDASEGRWVIDDVTSPCIDAGDPMSPIGYEPFPNGGIINMGAYGGIAEASKSYFGKPPCETIVAGDINGDCEVNFEDFRLMALHWLDEH